MRLFRIMSRRTSEERKSSAKENGTYPNFLRDVTLDRRFLKNECFGAVNAEDPELAEETDESF